MGDDYELLQIYKNLGSWFLNPDSIEINKLQKSLQRLGRFLRTW